MVGYSCITGKFEILAGLHTLYKLQVIQDLLKTLHAQSVVSCSNTS